MKMKQLLNAALGVALAMAPAVFGADKADDAKPAEIKEAAAPEVKPIDPKEVDKLLEFIPEIAAEAKGAKITGKEIKEVIKPQLLAHLTQGMEIPQEEIKGFAFQMANTMLSRQLILNEATEKGFKKDMDKGKEHVGKIKASVGEEQFKKMIAEMAYTEDYLIGKFAEEFMIEDYISSLAKCDEAEAKKFYEDNKKLFVMMKASHILAMFPGIQEGKTPTAEDKAKTLEKIKGIQKQIADGKDFAELAKTASDDPGSAAEGGSLGEFPEGVMVPEFEKALKGLKEGQISEPVETQFGYHLIKSGGIETRTFEDMKEEIIAKISAEKQQKAFSDLAKKLMKEKEGKILIEMPKAKPAPKDEKKADK